MNVFHPDIISSHKSRHIVHVFQYCYTAISEEIDISVSSLISSCAAESLDISVDVLYC